MLTKAEFRRRARTAQAGWTEGDLRASDGEIRRRVQGMAQWRSARTVFLYVSVRREPDTRALICAALAEGKRVVVPRCLGHGEMEAREIRSLEELTPAGFGLLEPGEAAPVVEPDEIDLAIVPCVAADRRGNRLGHGAGYYDRYLARTAAYRACLCRGENLFDELPAEAHDVRMDAIVTERDVILPG